MTDGPRSAIVSSPLRRLALAIALLAWPPAAHSAVAQQDASPRVQPLMRADGFGARTSAAQAGVGLDLLLGTYTRLEAVAAGGAATRGGTVTGSVRLEGLLRLLLDPLAESRLGPYAAAGVSGRADGPERRAYLVALLGVEGSVRKRFATAVEAGVGGGLRLGVVIRATAPDRR